MALYGQYEPNFRGPQGAAQERFHRLRNPNNGNPGGANNVSPSPSSNNEAPSLNPQSLVSDYAIRHGGQRPELARYVAPQLDAAGNPVPRDIGGYAYNLPNAAGNGGINPMFYRPMQSVFNPFNGGGDIAERMRQLIQRNPSGLPVSGQRPPNSAPGLGNGLQAPPGLGSGVGPQAANFDMAQYSANLGRNKPGLFSPSSGKPEYSNGTLPGDVSALNVPATLVQDMSRLDQSGIEAPYAQIDRFMNRRGGKY